MGLLELGMQAGLIGGKFKGERMLEAEAQKARQVAVQEGQLAVSQELVGIKKDYLKIAQADLGLRMDSHRMKREMHAWKKDDRETSLAKQQGIMEAATSGGYEGVIDYLKLVDPGQAIEIHAGKLKLESQMLQNDVLKSLAPAKKAEALLEGHQVLSRVGYAILNTPPEQQQGAYEFLLPMVKKINPAATGDLAKDSTMLLTSFALSMPENQIYGGNKQERTLGQQQVALDAQIQAAVNGGANPQTDPQLKAMMLDRQRLKEEQEKQGLKNLSVKNKQEMDVQKRVDNYNNYLQKTSKDYMEFVTLSGKMDASLEAYHNNPNNQPARNVIGRTIARIANGAGVMTDKDVEQVVNQSSVWQRHKAKFEGWRRGDDVNITVQDMNSLVDVYQRIKKITQDQQSGRESRMQRKIEADNTIHTTKIKMDNILFPSANLEKGVTRGSLVQQYGPQLQGLDAADQEEFLTKYLKAKEVGDQKSINLLIERLNSVR
jgi:hypothetical protein